jgi:hypothetical protein
MSDQMIDSIRAALAEGATPDARATGVAACRAILAELAPPSTEPARDPIPVAAIANALRGQSPDALLDLAIAKLRSLVPQDAPANQHHKLSIPLVPVRKR